MPGLFLPFCCAGKKKHRNRRAAARRSPSRVKTMEKTGTQPGPSPYLPEKSMEQYAREFYADRHERTLYSAATVLSTLLKHIPAVHSAVDIGCGVGTWLSVLSTKGAEEILGIDGSWVDRALLEIPENSFMQADLQHSTPLPGRTWDLALCMEVAEHLPAESARAFITFLTTLSRRVLFSAAIPFQGGIGHINEQWPEYWVELFDEQGYGVHDIIRPEIWNDSRIPFWYRQNTLLFSRKENTGEHRQTSGNGAKSPTALNLVHPDLYLGRQATGAWPEINRAGNVSAR